MSEKDFKNQIEAILFASGRFMDLDTIQSLTNASNKQVIKNNVEKLIKEYEQRESPLMIIQEKDGWKITVREKYLHLVRKIVADLELPKTILETLAIIAWQAPVLQSKVIETRHNKAYDHIKELEELGFIIKEKQGRSFMLKLANKFFDYFEVDDKKGIKELFKDIKKPELKQEEQEEAKEKINGLEVYSSQEQESKKEPVAEETEGEHLGNLEIYEETGAVEKDTDISEKEETEDDDDLEKAEDNESPDMNNKDISEEEAERDDEITDGEDEQEQPTSSEEDFSQQGLEEHSHDKEIADELFKQEEDKEIPVPEDKEEIDKAEEELSS
ncbi:SMC-Scp complex subunit ScpB [Candidatus Woesearchaeota archaeon]|nr:SMC-Scp complex subunit ScpB [Candidatus Woesearchaeota archaeon]